jgi:hypothetical protein
MPGTEAESVKNLFFQNQGQQWLGKLAASQSRRPRITSAGPRPRNWKELVNEELTRSDQSRVLASLGRARRARQIGRQSSLRNWTCKYTLNPRPAQEVGREEQSEGEMMDVGMSPFQGPSRR